MATRKKAEVGQHYRMVGTGGGPSTLWEVTRVFLPWQGGFEHACIMSETNIGGLSETMTLATSVIANKNRFVLES